MRRSTRIRTEQLHTNYALTLLHCGHGELQCTEDRKKWFEATDDGDTTFEEVARIADQPVWKWSEDAQEIVLIL